MNDVNSQLIRPPGGSAESLSTDAVRTIIERREQNRPVFNDGFLGRRSLAALIDLQKALSADPAFGAFAAVLENLPEAEDNWAGAWKAAKAAGVDDDCGGAVAFLLAERNTSSAAGAPFAVALTLTTLEVFGVPENGALSGARSEVVRAARQLAETYGEAFTAFLSAQHRLTAELLSGAGCLTLLRGERRPTPHEGDGPLALDLRPLSSWTTDEQTARGITAAPDASGGGGGGYLWLLSADVPADRVLSTSATGFGAPFEFELVLVGGRSGDACTVAESGPC